MTAHTEDQDDITELRAALQQAVRWLYFAAGREAASDPGASDRLRAAADGLTDVLHRTAPPP